MNHYLVWDYQELTKAWAVLTSYFQLTSSSMKKSKQISLLRPRFQSKMRYQTAEALVGFKQAKLKTVSLVSFTVLILTYAAKLILFISGNIQVFFSKKGDFKSLQQFQSTLWNGLHYLLATAGITQKMNHFFLSLHKKFNFGYYNQL